MCCKGLNTFFGYIRILNIIIYTLKQFLYFQVKLIRLILNKWRLLLNYAAINRMLISLCSYKNITGLFTLGAKIFSNGE